MKQQNGLSRSVKLLDSEITKKIKVYDVDKKELLGIFTLKEAADFTGVSQGHIHQAIAHKWRCYKNKLNKTICFRQS